jgi:DNA-binding winged helix-turn-helix (wHTH) protein
VAPEGAPSRSRFRFGNFLVSPARRVLLRDGREVPLIPRYFDLLLLLVERREQAVHRRDIFDRVWRDVVVSDGALSQAVRTLRRALGDAPREPAFIRTVSRHGYRFVYAGVVEEADDAALPAPSAAPARPSDTADSRSTSAVAAPPPDDALDSALARLLAPGPLDDDERREAAETVHTLGTDEALRRLDRRPGHAAARALLRDVRWDVAGAGAVPLLGQPGLLETTWILLSLRLRRALRLAGQRWTAASGGGAVAGLCAGILGGLALCLAPGSHTPLRAVVALGLVGGAIGGVGAAGVGAGLAAAEALVRSSRGFALVSFGALGGGSVGALSHLLGRWTLENLFGHELTALGGGFEGVVLGAAAGLGYAVSTPRPGGGMATPRGAARVAAALSTGLACALGAMGLTWLGGHLGGVSIDYMARQFQGSQVGLAPVARFFGENELGPVTRTVLSAYEGMLFGLGLVIGLTRRPPQGEPGLDPGRRDR